MKKMIQVILMFQVFAVMSILLAGCSGAAEVKEEAEPEALAIVIGNHGCSRKPNLNSTDIMEEVVGTIRAYGFIAVVNADGAPSTVIENSYDISEQYKKAADVKLDADARSKANELMEQLGKIKADDEEVDTLKAIRLAADSLSAAPENAKKVMIVVDTGVTTAGVLDMRNHLLSADPEAILEIADLLEEKSAIPDLKGIKVIWQHLGNVAAPQQELTYKQDEILETIWSSIIERGGGTFERTKAGQKDGEVSGELPYVSTVEVAAEEPIQFKPDNIDEMEFEQPKYFTEEQIRFRGDSDIYVEREKAMEAIEPIAEYMRRNEDFKLLLIGTTAGDGDSAYVRSLSADRANAVKKSLIELGITSERVIALGLGSRDPWHISNVGTEGEFAAQNRKVVMINAETEEAQRILQDIERR